MPILREFIHHIVAILLVILVLIADYYFGVRINLNVIYFIPILYLTWHFNRWIGITFVILFIGFSLFISIIYYQEKSMQMLITNYIIKGICYSLCVFFLSAFKKRFEIEKQYARTDFLTGLANRKSFFEMASREVIRSSRKKTPVAIAYIDCDDFKKVNDKLGHVAGDMLLKSVSNTIINNTREYDIICRIGGDEFVIFFPEMNQEEAVLAIERIQKEVLGNIQKNKWSTTLSIGIACFPSASLSIEDMLKQADDAMYMAKKQGKNRIVIQSKIKEALADKVKN